MKFYLILLQITILSIIVYVKALESHRIVMLLSAMHYFNFILNFSEVSEFQGFELLYKRTQ